ncbi:helix-turn-helix domain-containing protein [Aerococcus sp. UMB1112A]|uniref:helix-turn-helix domain-containing protein n=1 Tax=Aerococcus sp. UMB1112A TaxID=3050609 RepID=UPI0025516A77|nr:helix-turn-helix domain-containing protein [Aerococcus sp. UMB1112A]MDK8502115.1 helix-turn-helix domain-containing protein [Aerococcus sp. UMB1112A]
MSNNAIEIKLDAESSKELIKQVIPYLNEAGEELKRNFAITRTMLTIEEVSDFYKTSRSTIIENWHKQLGLPLSKLGNKIYIERTVLDDFIRAHPYQ